MVPQPSCPYEAEKFLVIHDCGAPKMADSTAASLMFTPPWLNMELIRVAVEPPIFPAPNEMEPVSANPAKRRTTLLGVRVVTSETFICTTVVAPPVAPAEFTGRDGLLSHCGALSDPWTAKVMIAASSMVLGSVTVIV